MLEIEFFHLHVGEMEIHVKHTTDAKSRVHTGPGKPGNSWSFIMAFSRTAKSWKKATGPGKFWKSVKLN